MSAAASSAVALIERATVALAAAGAHFGHGTDNAADEAAFLVLHALGLPFDVPRDAFERAQPPAAVAAVEALLEARIARRVPAAYLARRMWFAGHEFYVDERVLVPRSPLAELIGLGVQPWLGEQPVRRILDIGTGSGCIAIAAALAWPAAEVDATDLSADALAVAAINRDRHGLGTRLALHRCDLFPGQGGPWDLIISNPPYVPAASYAALPAEYRHEPRLALEAGSDGMDCVERILAGARSRLAPGGLLVVEVGEITELVAARHPELPFTWVEFTHGGEGVFVLAREDLPAAA